MDIGAALADRVDQDRVDESDDGRVLRGALERDDVLLGLGLRDLELILLKLLDDLLIVDVFLDCLLYTSPSPRD